MSWRTKAFIETNQAIMFQFMNSTTKAATDTVIVRLGAFPVNGTSGSFAGTAGKGSLLIDDLHGGLYQNTGTKASPTWTNSDTNTGS